MPDVKNIYFVYSLFQTYNPKWLQMLGYNTWDCWSESGTVQQATGNAFLSTQRWMVAFSFLGYWEEWDSKERNWLRIPYALSKIHWASEPQCPLQPLGYAGPLPIRRRCNSRFRCTQLVNTTPPSFFYITEIFWMGRKTHHIWLLWATQTAPIRLRRCAGWNELLLTAHAQQDPFSHGNLWFGVTMVG